MTGQAESTDGEAELPGFGRLLWYRSTEIDGRMVVEIETGEETGADVNPDTTPAIRVYVNDGLVYGEPVDGATCILTGAPGENDDDCTTHAHRSV